MLKGKSIKPDNELEDFRFMGARMATKLSIVAKQLKYMMGQQHKSSLELQLARSRGGIYNNPLQTYIDKDCNTLSPHLHLHGYILLSPHIDNLITHKSGMDGWNEVFPSMEGIKSCRFLI